MASTTSWSIPTASHTNSISLNGVEWDDFFLLERRGPQDIVIANSATSIPRDIQEKTQISLQRRNDIYKNTGIKQSQMSAHRGGWSFYVKDYVAIKVTADDGTETIVPFWASQSLLIPDSPLVTTAKLREVLNRPNSFTFEYISSTSTFADRLDQISRGQLAPILA